MSNLKDGLDMVYREIAKKSITIEDSAVAQYIKSQADYLVAIGADLTEYDLVRDAGNFELKDGKYVGSVRYGLRKTSELRNVNYGE